MSADPTYTRPSDPLAAVIGDVIQALPAATRIFPDAYADKVAEAVRAYFEEHELGAHYGPGRTLVS